MKVRARGEEDPKSGYRVIVYQDETGFFVAVECFGRELNRAGPFASAESLDAAVGHMIEKDSQQ